MPAKIIALYGTPADPAHFNDYYFNKHVPIAKTLPGLLDCEVNSSPVMDNTGKVAHHLAAILSFDSAAAMQAALASPEGAATAADLANFASGGVQLLFFETRAV